MSRRPRLRRWAAWLARRTLSPSDAERLLADLEDELVRYGRSSAWYWSQLLRSLPHLRRTAPGRHGAGSGADLLREAVRAARSLRRTPGHTAAAVASLALGIGATTALFSVVDAVVLRPLPYAHPERIVRAWADRDDGSIVDFTFRVLELQDLERRPGTFEAVGGEFPASFTIQLASGEPARVEGRLASAHLFRVFGVEPRLGRMFTEEEVAAADRRVAVVSHGFWTRVLGADPDAVGRTAALDGTDYTVLGVLPAEYRHVSGEPDVFIPYSLGTSRWIARWLDVYALLAPGASPEAARDRIDATMDEIGRSDRRSVGWHSVIEPLHEMVVGDIEPVVWGTFGVVILVLLIACLNVANLSLARFAGRRTELSVRTALGAGRVRLAWELLVESAVLAAAGGIAGLLLASWGVRVLVRTAPADIPRIAEASLHPGVLLFALGATLLTCLVFGVAPAFRAARGPEVGSLRARGAGRLGPTGGALVAAEVAVASVLVALSGLVVETVRHLQAEELGFRQEGAASFRIDIPFQRYGSRAEALRLLGDVRDALEVTDAIDVAAWGTDLPLSGEGAVTSVTTEARRAAGIEEAVASLQRRGGPGYMDALGAPLLEGREFADEDGPDTPLVALLSESLARTLFPGESAVGRRVGFGSDPAPEEWMTVVGVVGDIRFEEVEIRSMPQVWQAHAQSPTLDVGFVVRGAAPPQVMLDAARSVLRALDETIPLYEPTPLGSLVDRSLASRRFTASVFRLFASLALVLALAGVYGVLSYLVGRSRRDVGVRMALGARARSVEAMVVGRGMRWVALGLAVGLPAAAGCGLLLDRLLFGVAPSDPGVLARMAGIVVGASLAAAWLPARRAAHTDPMTVLRQE